MCEREGENALYLVLFVTRSLGERERERERERGGEERERI